MILLRAAVVGPGRAGPAVAVPDNEESTMRQFSRWLVAGVALGLVVVAAARAADEGEKKVPLDKVPKAVLDAVKAKFEGAEIKGASTEKDGDKLVYEIQIVHKGHKADVSLTPEGKILSVEKEIKAADLPEKVAAAIKDKYPGAKIKLAEEVSEGGKIKFEVLLVKGDKSEAEVVFDPDGKVLKEEKKEAKKDKKDKD
jgi:uncharacterized membrane protein YkoI